MDTIAVAMQCNASFHGRDAGPGDAFYGTLPGLSIRQRLFVQLFLHCFRLFSIFGKGHGGCSVVCIVPRGMLGKVTQRTAAVKTP